ncbi:transposase [Dictyoglomus sp.]|uniref:transposase n=1 Tax=Dictyoglomus sp. TaxID=28205 RepID=UPI003D11CDB4
MRLTMEERKKLTKIVSERYQKSSKKQKGVILDEFVALTGYDRCYASYLLRNHGRKVRVNSNTVMVADVGRRPRRKRQRIYDQKVFIALKKIWEIMDFICAKRLAPIIGELLPILRKYREVKLDASTARKLLKISARLSRILCLLVEFHIKKL